MPRITPLNDSGPHASLLHVDRAAWLLAIARNGADESSRAGVWLQLLGCLQPGEDETAARANAQQQYNELRQQVTAMAPSPPPAWAEVQRQLAVDIPRAPHNLPLLSGGHRAAGLTRLTQVLEALCVSDVSELGYWQGYTDLAAPFIHVFQTDWEAWWALHALVGCRLRHAFAADSAIEAVREDLAEAARALEREDSVLFKHMSRMSAKLGHAPTQCAFQSAFILFTRDVPPEQLMMLWECMWAWEELLAIKQQALKLKQKDGRKHAGHNLVMPELGAVQGDVPHEAPSLRPYVTAALLLQHRAQLLKCRSIELVIQLMNRLPPPPGGVVAMAARAHAMWCAMHAQPVMCMRCVCRA